MYVRAKEEVGDRLNEPSKFKGRRVHMIGIGGCGMSGAARVLADLGAVVSGSDLQPFKGLGALVQRNVRVVIGHDDKHIDPDVDLVVTSAAVPQSNPELVQAQRGGLEIVKYAELVGALMDQRCGIAVAGTHGKSTTAAMAAYLLREAGLDPSFLFGAQSPQLGGNAAIGQGRYFVVEACEFDRSFLHLRPSLAVILNIEPDHLDCYQTFDAVVKAFAEFAANVAADGLLICNAEDRWAMKAASAAGATVETFGFGEDADWRALNLGEDRGRFTFEVVFRGSPILNTSLSVPGKHNVQNALAAIALACRAGADPQAVARALPTFSGIDRRMTWRGRGRGVDIVDDYAHHPTEIRATIEAVRRCYQPKRVLVVFQPHQYARTRHLFEDFATSFEGVDEVIVPDIYGAREEGAEGDGVGSRELASRICEQGVPARYLSTLEAAADRVVQHAAEGDLIVTMGAGDVWKVADELVNRVF